MTNDEQAVFKGIVVVDGPRHFFPDIMHSSISLRSSTPPQNRQLNVRISGSRQ